ncbi:trypco2 family protein [Streptomyces sp. NPDC001982]|uniref:trypco2 family protein n=1 Tax=Streptomyces sp. NPDC001982 TaxID=3154405 RepID=UPI00332E7317
MSPEVGSIDLAEAIKAVRLQLKEASASAQQDEIQMEVDALELEFTIEVRHDSKAKAGIKAWVITADAETGLTRSGTHRVKISLKPKTRLTGESVKVGDETPESLGDTFPFS